MRRGGEEQSGEEWVERRESEGSAVKGWSGESKEEVEEKEEKEDEDDNDDDDDEIEEELEREGGSKERERNSEGLCEKGDGRQRDLGSEKLKVRMRGMDAEVEGKESQEATRSKAR